MESQPQNPEFRNNPENFHPCTSPTYIFSQTIKWRIKCLASGHNTVTPVSLELATLQF